MGVTKTKLACNESTIFHDFHVMHENAYLRTDGILGADFLLKYNANIDIAKSALYLNLSSHSQLNEGENNTKCISSSLVRQPVHKRTQLNETI